MPATSGRHPPRSDVTVEITAQRTDRLGWEAERLLRAARDLASAHEARRVTEVVRRAARELTSADGVTFVLREGELVHYVDEEAIAPLWAGRRFPVAACVSGWAMTHRQPVVIEDVYADERIPVDLYRPTFVTSLALVPVRVDDPVAAIGAYWARRHRATARELHLLESLAGLAAVALANQALYAELRQAVEARDEFLSIASHELRTPLTPLWLHVQRLRRIAERGEAVVDAAEVKLAAEKTERHVARMASLVGTLLDASRVLRGPVVLTKERVDLRELVRDVADRAAPELDAARCRLAVDAGVAVTALADPLRLEQVLLNLLANAARHAPGTAVALRLRRDGANAVVEVEDSGPGIPADQHERIFLRFERAAPPGVSGLGLGLYLGREIARAHGGDLGLRSAPGRGTTFTLTVPALEDDAGA